MTPSFFSRLTGSASEDSFSDSEYDETESDQGKISDAPHGADLRVDVYQVGEVIVLKAFTPGVLPNDVELSLTRDMLTISATREEITEVSDEDYFTRELDWSPLERTILLPAEVDIDLAEATESHGVLTIRLPKVNKERERKIKVTKSNKTVTTLSN